MTLWGAPTLTYDGNGNLVNDGVYIYTWNARNQLVQLQQGANTIASYQYDAFGRRQQKVVNGTATRFVYDGQNFVQERDGSDAVTANVLSGLRMDEVFARTKGAATTSYLVDHLGSIIAEANATGAIQTTYSYEPYGKTVQTGTASDSTQRYTGREQDTADLYYYRARYDPPVLDRFISEDPIGFLGDANVYGYVGGDPIARNDPMGLYALPGEESSACQQQPRPPPPRRPRPLPNPGDPPTPPCSGLPHPQSCQCQLSADQANCDNDYPPPQVMHAVCMENARHRFNLCI